MHRLMADLPEPLHAILRVLEPIEHGAGVEADDPSTAPPTVGVAVSGVTFQVLVPDDLHIAEVDTHASSDGVDDLARLGLYLTIRELPTEVVLLEFPDVLRIRLSSRDGCGLDLELDTALLLPDVVGVPDNSSVDDGERSALSNGYLTLDAVVDDGIGEGVVLELLGSPFEHTLLGHLSFEDQPHVDVTLVAVIAPPGVRGVSLGVSTESEVVGRAWIVRPVDASSMVKAGTDEALRVGDGLL